MQCYITSEINKRTHLLQKVLGCSWKFAFNLAIDFDIKNFEDFVCNSWSLENTRVLARHYWSLSRGYEEIFETGKSIAMMRASKILFAYCDQHKVGCSLSSLKQKYISDSTIREAFEFLLASDRIDYTPRSKYLIEKEASNYLKFVRIPYWNLESTNSEVSFTKYKRVN